MLEALNNCGIRRCGLVIGYQGDRILDHIETLSFRPELAFHYNPEFTDGSVVSLASAKETLTSGREVLLLDADVLFHPGILERLVHSNISNCYLMDRNFEPGAEPVKIAMHDGQMVEFSKQLMPELEYDILGESVGFFRFSPECARRISERCGRFLESGREAEPHEAVLREELLERPGDFGVEDITGLPWLEIDFADDIDRANRHVLPAIRSDYPEF